MIGQLGGGVGQWESAQIKFNPTGNVQVMTGSHSHGQSHETTFAQIVSDKLGVPIEKIEVVHGDTATTPFGMGTYGSRSLAVGGSAIMKAADKIIAKGKKIAAHLMEASVADVVFEQRHLQGRRHRQDRAARRRRCSPPTCRTTIRSTSSSPAWTRTPSTIRRTSSIPAGTQICEVEIDPDTGAVEIVNHTAVDDFGNIINPMIVEGQVHGGIAQGVGQALLENAVYDKETGQLVSGSYMDYAMPRADDVPSFKLGYKVTPCPHNPLGVKGCGEAGAIAAPAAVMNAVHDALAPLGVTHVPMPATPLNVWQDPWRRSGRVTEELRCTISPTTAPSRWPTPSAALKGKPEARAMSGGMTLIPTLKQRLAKPSDVVDLNGIKELAGIKVEGNGVTIGGMTRHADVASSADVKARDPGAGPSRRPYRRPAGAQPRHDRRLGRQQRSGGRLSGGGAWRSTPPSPPTAARSRPTTSSRACSRRRSRTAS